MTLIGEKRLDKILFNPTDLNRFNYLKHKLKEAGLNITLPFYLATLPPSCIALQYL